ncbi:MAG TPA: agmatinase [Acidobacteriota bacterium]|nr:agmatinase [Acidobacteriota bacterium]
MIHRDAGLVETSMPSMGTNHEDTKTLKIIPFAGCFGADARAEGFRGPVFVGLPDDSQSSYLKGSAGAPEVIRVAYDGRCYNSTSESGIDLAGEVGDFGDILAEDCFEKTYSKYRSVSESLFAAGKVPFFAGGDHAVTVPVVDGMKALGQPVQVVQIDAHPDLYPEFEGSRFSHACTAARILEMDHVERVVQMGIRALSPIQQEQIKRFSSRLRLLEARELDERIELADYIECELPVYISVDMDGFDPAYAQGVSHPVPGGLSPRQVLNLFRPADWRLVGMDTVEVNPLRDVNNLTAILAARVLHEGMAYSWLQS